MQKILVFSDSHGRTEYVMRMLDKETECQTVFFLGDGLNEVEKVRQLYPDKSFIAVKGNNDFQFYAEQYAYKHIDGVTFMACHGDMLSVRYTLRELFNKAHSVRANVALYGHTHISNAAFDSYSGVCAVNPGALCDGNYCIIEVNEGKYDIIRKQIG